VRATASVKPSVARSPLLSALVMLVLALAAIAVGAFSSTAQAVVPQPPTAAYAYDSVTTFPHSTVATLTLAAVLTDPAPEQARPVERASARSRGSVVAAETAGGVGPAAQGAAGVDRTVADLEAAGGKVLGREISVDVNGVRTRPDLFVEFPHGQQGFIEVKTGAGARLTPNQATGFPGIRSGGAVPVGGNAAGAGLAPGVPMGAMPVWIVRQPWPLG